MFTPPFCPYRDCPRHSGTSPQFAVRHGTYHPKCRSHPVQRYRCRTCSRTFSRQTFRVDYRDHRPELNAPLFTSIASGIGIRQTARNLGLSFRCTELKLRKIARHARRLNLNVREGLSGTVRFHFDELETFEGQRNARPLTVGVLIESESRFIVWAESAAIRPRGKMTEKRLMGILRAERHHGTRKDGSRRCIERTLARGARLTSEAACVLLSTDEKPSYKGLATRAFRDSPLAHLRTNSQLARGTWNPLFPINHEEALMRDLMGRMRRQSWLASKQRRYLDLGLQIHMAYRNLVRRRFNHDRDSPAAMLGFASRRMSVREVLAWRQDWGRRSVHPLSRSGKSVEARRRREAWVA